MRVLVLTAAVCCLCLTGIAVALWWSIRGHKDEAATAHAGNFPPTPPPGSSYPTGTSPAAPIRAEHPRLDLAAGTVPRAQAVRPRRRFGVPETEPSESAAVLPHAHRPDRANYNKDLGDLRDPDIRRGYGPRGTLSVPEK